jgi:hypothetical protein
MTMPDESDTISTLTPEEATGALAERALRYQRSQAAGAAPPVGSALGAKLELEALTANALWRDKYFSGDAEARRQFTALTSRIADGTGETADALAGAPLPPPGTIETTTGKEMSRRTRADAVAGLRELGMNDATILQAIDGAEVGAHELAAARMQKSMRLSDAEWVKRYMAGGLAEKREMGLLNLIIAGAPA